MMAERGILLAHTTILRWVQRYVPDFEKRWSRYARPVGDSWRVDETYIKVRGQWVYLYRAVDKQGRTVDFLLSKRRDVEAAKRFFSRAAKQHGAPRVITLDGYAPAELLRMDQFDNLRKNSFSREHALRIRDTASSRSHPFLLVSAYQ